MKNFIVFGITFLSAVACRLPADQSKVTDERAAQSSEESVEAKEHVVASSTEGLSLINSSLPDTINLMYDMRSIPKITGDKKAYAKFVKNGEADIGFAATYSGTWSYKISQLFGSKTITRKCTDVRIAYLVGKLVMEIRGCDSGGQDCNLAATSSAGRVSGSISCDGGLYVPVSGNL